MRKRLDTIIWITGMIQLVLSKTTLKFGLFLPGDIGTSFYNSKGLLPMGEVARDQINNSPNVLNDYEVATEWFNTKADAGIAIHELFKFIGTNDDREYIGIVGPLLTGVTTYVSELAPFFNYVTVSPTASGASLQEDKNGTEHYKYGNSLRLHAVETDIYNAVLQLASRSKCNWSEIHVLTGERTDSKFESSVIQLLTDYGEKNNISIHQYSFTPRNKRSLETALTDLKKNRARIIVANFVEDDALDVFCMAGGSKMDFLSEHEEYTGRRVWILPSSFANNWYTKADKACKEDVLKGVGTYLTSQFSWNTTEQVLGTNYTFNETWESYSTRFYKNYAKDCNCAFEAKAAGLMYDSVWTLALGLHKFLYYYDGDSKKLGDTLNTKEKRDMLLSEVLNRTGSRSKELLDVILNVAFEGASGKIEFQNANDPTCRSGFVVKIQQLVFNKTKAQLVDVCTMQDSLICKDLWTSSIFDGKNSTNDCGKYEDNSKSYYGCVCPRSSAPEEGRDQIIIGIPIVTLIVFTILSIFGTILSTCFFIFNIVFMKERVIKMSSPMINNVILLGSVLLYSYVPISGLMTGVNGYSTSDDAYLIKLCSFSVKEWILCIGFTTSFGALFAKTWRVYAIFTSKKPRNMILSDGKLFILIFILLLVDVILLTTHEFINNYEWSFVPKTTAVKEVNLLDDKPTDSVTILCKFVPDGKNNSEVHWIIYGALIYKGLLLIFGAFIAFQTRNITIPALNDSKYIGISIYTTVVVVMICGPVSIFLSSQPDVKFAVISTCIIFPNTVMLCLVFLPKAYQLRYQPKEAVKNQTVRDWDSVALSTRKNSEVQVRQLQDELEKRESVIQVLKENVVKGGMTKTNLTRVDEMSGVERNGDSNNNVSPLKEKDGSSRV